MLPWGRMGSPFRGDILLPLFLPRSTVRASQREGVEVTDDDAGCCRSVGLFFGFVFFFFFFASIRTVKRSRGVRSTCLTRSAAYASRALIREGRRLTYTDSLGAIVGDSGEPQAKTGCEVAIAQPTVKVKLTHTDKPTVTVRRRVRADLVENSLP